MEIRRISLRLGSRLKQMARDSRTSSDQLSDTSLFLGKITCSALSAIPRALSAPHFDSFLMLLCAHSALALALSALHLVCCVVWLYARNALACALSALLAESLIAFCAKRACLCAKGVPGKETVCRLRSAPPSVSLARPSILLNFFCIILHILFSSMERRKLLMERKVSLKPEEASDFVAEYTRRRWERLGSYPEPANIAIVREFYANAVTIDDDAPATYTSYVRGHSISFTPATINEFLHTTLELGQQCEYSQFLTTRMPSDIRHTQIEEAVCREGGRFHQSTHGLPLHIKRTNLLPVAKIWMNLIHSNLAPVDHASDIHLNRSYILFNILSGKRIDLGTLIAEEIQSCADSTIGNAKLGHPSQITHLCRRAGVDTSVGPFERPRQSIDARYVSAHCQLSPSFHEGEAPATAPEVPPQAEAPEIPLPQPQAPQAPEIPPPQHQVPEVPSQQATVISPIVFDTAMQMIFRAQRMIMDTIRAHAAVTAPDLQFPYSMEEFGTATTWPGVQAIFERGGGESTVVFKDRAANTEPEVQPDVEAEREAAKDPIHADTEDPELQSSEEAIRVEPLSTFDSLEVDVGVDEEMPTASDIAATDAMIDDEAAGSSKSAPV
uniref:Putative plant transposon protein domain-containing protein n=1 Tax=Cajanus cajan TaxID=3821 RepID=A0A151SFN4_CAJCA|nr:hypothetical protein KK1_024441 [Cajanus cajan]